MEPIAEKITLPAQPKDNV